MKIKLLGIFLSFSLQYCGCSVNINRNTESGGAEESQSFFAMNTYMTFTAYGENAETALAEAKDRIATLEQLWSVTDEHSEIYAVNDNVDSAVQTEFDMTPIHNFCNELYARDTAKKIKTFSFVPITAVIREPARDTIFGQLL